MAEALSVLVQATPKIDTFFGTSLTLLLETIEFFDWRRKLQGLQRFITSSQRRHAKNVKCMKKLEFPKKKSKCICYKYFIRIKNEKICTDKSKYIKDKSSELILFRARRDNEARKAH